MVAGGRTAFVPGDHSPLLAMGGQATMLAPERERWAVAVLESVGEERELGCPDGGSWYVFDVGLRVLDGWNVPSGPVTSLWNEANSRTRRALLKTMLGARVLVRFAPTEDGKFLIVDGDDEHPVAEPTFAIGSKPLLDVLLPTTATRMPTGTPAERRFYALWTAGASLSSSAYPAFAPYSGGATLPETDKAITVRRRAADGSYDYTAKTPGKDVAWLRKLAAGVSPEFQMMTEYVLYRSGVDVAMPAMRDLVRLAIHAPERFPNGLLPISDLGELTTTAYGRFPRPLLWQSDDAMLKAILKGSNSLLRADLLDLVSGLETPLQIRTRLLPLLSEPDPHARNAALRAFRAWQGEPPKDTDPVAWHTARVRLGKKELVVGRG